MNSKLSENIRALRRERGLTQEQLSEALGVTVGAVSKWENAASTPELPLVMELADFFEVSVDALLGYEPRSNDREHIIRRLKDYVHNKELSRHTVVMEVEKALKKHPNNFQVVYRCARLCCVRGGEWKDADLAARGLNLMERACLLIEQNTDESISLVNLQMEIAEVHGILGDHEKAVELLKKNNPCRVHHHIIGSTLASVCNRPEEAAPYLSDALLDALMKLVYVVNGYLNVYEKRGNYLAMREIARWGQDVLAPLRYPDRPNFLDVVRVDFLAVGAYASLRLGRREEAKDYFCQARDVARKYDANPSYRCSDVRFVSPDCVRTAHSYPDGSTQGEAIERFVQEQNDPELAALWEEVRRGEE